MQIVSVTRLDEITYTGRNSDGSDRQQVVTPRWEVELVDDAGVVRRIQTSFDPQTNPQGLIDLLPKPQQVQPTRKADLETYIATPFRTWQMWQAIRVEAQARAIGAAAITALQTRENAAWTDLVAAISAWRTAA